ncbi:MAG: alpha/beta hydrolase [Flavobacteriales bacterium]
MKIYLLPGIACDHRLFARLDLNGHDVVKLDWPRFREGASVKDIAVDLLPLVDAAQPHVLVGVSLGGMVVQEIASMTNPHKVVLVSTWTAPREWPWFVRLGAALRAGALVNSTTMRMSWPVKRALGSRDMDTDRFLMDMAWKEGPAQIRRGVQAVLRWKGSTWTGSTIRIHGDHDGLMPMTRIRADHVVRGGTHAMVYCQAEAVSAALRTALTG